MDGPGAVRALERAPAPAETAAIDLGTQGSPRTRSPAHGASLR